MEQVLTGAEISWATAFTGIRIEPEAPTVWPAPAPAAGPRAMAGAPAASLAEITIYPRNAVLSGAGSQDFVATADYPDGTSRDVTAAVLWSASDPSIKIDANGRATASAVAAVATITATDLETGASGTATMTVTVAGPVPDTPKAPVLDAVTVSAALLAAGGGVDGSGVLQLTATGTYSDGSTRDITADVLWQSSNPAVTIDAKHMAFAKPAPAKATITATDFASGASGSVAVTVPLAEPDALLREIIISPADPSIEGGGRLQLVATAKYGDGSTRDLTGAVQWQSSDPSIAVDASGLASARPVTATATITATDPASRVSATTAITVAPSKGMRVLQSIAITPGNATIEAGGVLQFGATGKFDDGATLDLTGTVAWQSSLAAVSVDVNGKATAELVSATATITATERASGLTGSTEVSVAAPQERRVQTKFGEFSYWSYAEPAVRPLLAEAASAYDALEPMNDRLDKAYAELVQINAKIGDRKTVLSEIDQYTDRMTKIEAGLAMGAKIQADALEQDVAKLDQDLADITQEIAIDETELTAKTDEIHAAEYRKIAQEVDRETHTIVTFVKNFAKGVIKEDPTVIIDEAADLLETLVKSENPWKAKAEALEKKARDLGLQAATGRHELALKKFDELKDFAKEKLRTANEAKAHFSGKWSDAEKHFDRNPGNKGEFRFENLAKAIRLARLVAGFAAPVHDAAEGALAAVDKLGKFRDPRGYWMADRDEDLKILDAWSDTTRQMSQSAQTRLQSATTWLEEYGKIYVDAHAAMEHAPA